MIFIFFRAAMQGSILECCFIMFANFMFKNNKSID